MHMYTVFIYGMGGKRRADGAVGPAKPGLSDTNRKKRNGAELKCVHSRTHSLKKKIVTERTKTSGSEKEGMLIERRRQAAGAAALLLALLFSTTGSMSGILVGWNHLPLCTPAASVSQAIDPSHFCIDRD